MHTQHLTTWSSRRFTHTHTHTHQCTVDSDLVDSQQKTLQFATLALVSPLHSLTCSHAHSLLLCGGIHSSKSRAWNKGLGAGSLFGRWSWEAGVEEWREWATDGQKARKGTLLSWLLLWTLRLSLQGTLKHCVECPSDFSFWRMGHISTNLQHPLFEGCPSGWSHPSLLSELLLRKPTSRLGAVHQSQLKSEKHWEHSAWGSSRCSYKQHWSQLYLNHSFLPAFSHRILNSTRKGPLSLFPQCLAQRQTHGSPSGLICWMKEGTSERTIDWI